MSAALLGVLRGRAVMKMSAGNVSEKMFRITSAHHPAHQRDTAFQMP